MAYEYEEFLIKQFNEAYRTGNLKQINLINELKEVYIKAKAFDELKKNYLDDLRSALNTTLEYSHPDAPCTADMGSISFLLQQILEDLEDK
ncbi:hypothetical protein [Mammaliicoccus sciuri]|uniref:hypothetical protein n=1 Tax=Mammaliicoccus sciuri TaxID=1296 RepID=UPI001FB2D547|nr:hypothetical protein [Mammaliicoccus sciuri]MCJ1783109.1 hypothetical protein [Mammaliicoccus sciuri]